MNLLGASILCTVLIVILTASRRVALMGMMAGILFLTQGQQLQIAGFNMYALRFIELAGFFRVVVRKEFSFSNLTRIDRIFLILLAYSTIVFLLRSEFGHANQIGTALDTALAYFSFRGLLNGVEDLKWFLKSFLVLLIPYTAIVLVESFFHFNAFASMGGIEFGSWMRDGRPRCQGSFRHPSLLGTFAATFVPLYISLFFSKNFKTAAALGGALCLTIVWATNSGGPLNCVAIGVAGWSLWGIRTRMKLVRRTLAIGSLALASVMKAPIWYLPAKASSLSGGDGWHRSYLMDIAAQNFDKWWLAGMSITATQGWFPYELESTGGADITNQYLAYGICAGVIAILIFFYLLIGLFSQLGKALSASRTNVAHNTENERILWGLGCVLAVHMVNWLGITYFDQSFMIWLLQLAMIVNISEDVLKRNLAPK